MIDSEWIANIHNISNAEIFEQLEQCGCDGYYRDIWSACIEELQRRVNNPTGDLISREALKKDLASYDKEFAPDCVLNCIDNAPTVEVRDNKPKQGEWIFDGWGTYCSECGYRPKIGCGKFCSECGAQMQKGGAE